MTSQLYQDPVDRLSDLPATDPLNTIRVIKESGQLFHKQASGWKPISENLSTEGFNFEAIQTGMGNPAVGDLLGPNVGKWAIFLAPVSGWIKLTIKKASNFPHKTIKQTGYEATLNYPIPRSRMLQFFLWYQVPRTYAQNGLPDRGGAKLIKTVTAAENNQISLFIPTDRRYLTVSHRSRERTDTCYFRIEDETNTLWLVETGINYD